MFKQLHSIFQHKSTKNIVRTIFLVACIPTLSYIIHTAVTIKIDTEKQLKQNVLNLADDIDDFFEELNLDLSFILNIDRNINMTLQQKISYLDKVHKSKRHYITTALCYELSPKDKSIGESQHKQIILTKLTLPPKLDNSLIESAVESKEITFSKTYLINQIPCVDFVYPISSDAVYITVDIRRIWQKLSGCERVYWFDSTGRQMYPLEEVKLKSKLKLDFATVTKNKNTVGVVYPARLYYPLYFSIFAGLVVVSSLLYSTLRVAKQTIIIEEDKLKLQEADRLKKYIFAKVVHEIANPLTSIEGYAKWLKDNTSNFKQAQKSAIESIYNSATLITTLLADLRDYSRIKRGKFELKKSLTDIKELVNIVAERLAQKLKSKNITLHIVTPSGNNIPKVELDSVRIQQVLTNLIDNGWKYSPTGSKITVSIRNESKLVVVTVSDEGPGIPDRELQNVFRAFYQVTTYTESPEGFGLGLDISKKIIEAHGGKIWVSSEECRGTTFAFSLPVEST
ncbi:MAG: HAMP domain-containing sensor histidine kinase [Elusimicrobiota bacterium]|nr:HAMP domain-containing sensor histidine kinase [Elusimicrobiota bacterium]